MNIISRSELRQLIDIDAKSSVSIYCPTHRAGADTLQDPIRFKNLIREVEKSLELADSPSPLVRELVEPLWSLADQFEFWQHQADGLALFRSRDLFRYYRLPFPVPELSVVARRFHLKPLLPATETDPRFYVLALSQEIARLYEGDRERVVELEVSEMPPSPFGRPAGAEMQSSPRRRGERGGGRRYSLLHAHPAGERDRKQLLGSYFHRVNEAVRRKLSEPAPIVLAAVDYMCPIFRRASYNPDLLPAEIHTSPGNLSLGELHRLAWEIVSSHFRQIRDQAADEYHQLWHTQRSSNDFPAILNAARQGRIKTLFVAVGVQTWGHLDPITAGIVHNGQSPAEEQDLLNLAAMETFVAGGAVYGVPPDEVPGRRLAAAVFRY